MIKGISRWSTPYVTSQTLFTYPGTGYYSAVVQLAGFSLSDGTIVTIGIPSTVTFGSPTLVADAGIFFQIPPTIISGAIINPGIGYGLQNITLFGSTTVIAGPVPIVMTSLVNTNNFGLGKVGLGPILLISVQNVNNFGLATVYSFLPEVSLSTTVRSKTGIDIKLFNIFEDVPGLVEVVGYYDIDFTDEGDFVLEDGMRTNLIMSLFCERRAAPYEVALPNMRRGWWGNETSETVGFEIGSKIWLLEQSRLTTGTVNLAQQYAYKSMEWLVQDNLAAEISVSAAPQNITSEPGVVLDIKITTQANTVEYKWYTVWGKTH